MDSSSEELKFFYFKDGMRKLNEKSAASKKPPPLLLSRAPEVIVYELGVQMVKTSSSSHAPEVIVYELGVQMVKASSSSHASNKPPVDTSDWVRSIHMRKESCPS